MAERALVNIFLCALTNLSGYFGSIRSSYRGMRRRAETLERGRKSLRVFYDFQLLLDICISFLYNPSPNRGGSGASHHPFRGEEEAKTLSDMHSNMILAGFLIILVCQDLVAVKAFQRSVRDGLLCAVVPGYILIYASRGESRQVKPLIGWLAGFGILLTGLVR